MCENHHHLVFGFAVLSILFIYCYIILFMLDVRPYARLRCVVRGAWRMVCGAWCVGVVRSAWCVVRGAEWCCVLRVVRWACGKVYGFAVLSIYLFNSDTRATRNLAQMHHVFCVACVLCVVHVACVLHVLLHVLRMLLVVVACVLLVAC